MTTKSKSEETQVYRVYIKATPEAIWKAITDREWNGRYGYGSPAEYDLRPGGKYRGFASKEMKAYGGPDVVVDGEVVESDPPRKLVQTWRPLWDPEMVAEGFKRLTWEIEPGEGGVTSLTVTHELAGAPKTAEPSPSVAPKDLFVGHGGGPARAGSPPDPICLGACGASDKPPLGARCAPPAPGGHRR